jgi:hypothetical protein
MIIKKNIKQRLEVLFFFIFLSLLFLLLDDIHYNFKFLSHFNGLFSKR